MDPSLWKYGSHFHWIHLTPFPLDILINPASYNHGSALILLLNWLLCPLSNDRLPLVVLVYVGVESICMIYGEFGALPALQRRVDSTCCLSYGFFRHTHSHGRIIPHDIVVDSWGGEWWTFTIHPGGGCFLIPKLIRLRPWFPLVPVFLDFHNPILQKPMHTPPLFPLTHSFFSQS